MDYKKLWLEFIVFLRDEFVIDATLSRDYILQEMEARELKMAREDNDA